MAGRERTRALDIKPAATRAPAPTTARTPRPINIPAATSRLPSPQVASSILAGADRPVRAIASGAQAKVARSMPSTTTRVQGAAQAVVTPFKPAILARAPQTTTGPSAPPAHGGAVEAPTADRASSPVPMPDAAAGAAGPENRKPAADDAAAAQPERDGKGAKGEQPAEKQEKSGKEKKPEAAEQGEEGASKKMPSPREAIAPAASGVRQRAKVARGHSDPDVPGKVAQAAAKIPGVEQTRGAAHDTVSGMADTGKDAKQVARETFRQKLREKIASTTEQPKTEAQATKVLKQGATDASASLKSDLKTQRDAAAGPMKDAADTEVKSSDVKVDPESPLTLEPVGKPPGKVSGASVAPESLPAERLDYSSDREPADRAMSEAGVSKEQLEKGNEPAFGPTIEARSTAEKHEAKAEAQYRKSEAQVQGRARATAQNELAEGVGGMHGTRQGLIGAVVLQQGATFTKDALERKRVTDAIAGIKEKTKTDVKAILDAMDVEAVRIFDEGLKAAEKLYGQVFEDAKGGAWTWLTTWGDDWEELIEKSLGKARQAYLDRVDVAIDAVADYVDQQIEASKNRVAAGLTEVQTFVSGLEGEVQKFGTEALEEATQDFAALETEIDSRRDALIDKLADQYKASYERMSAMEEKLREENKSLWQRVYDATVGLIKKILAFKDMLLSILAKAAGVIADIISDPIGFLGNLIDGVMLGLKNFMGNIGAHLKKGLLDWLFGALGGAGLKLPETLDLEGIVSIVLQVLGLTYANFRARAVKIVGEPVVAALEEAAEVFKVLVTEGIPGLWRFIKDKLMDLKSMVLDAIFDFIKEKVIVAGVTWIIGLLNPASAFFKACKAIYDIVMFFINRGSQILALVNAVIDSIAAIVKGSIGVAAKFVEDALAKAIPVAIGFLASLLGLGDISGTIRKTIEKAQAPVNKAIDWVINGAVKLVKSAGNLVKGLFGKKEDKKEKATPDADPAKAAKIQAGLVALHQLERDRLTEGKLTRAEADQVAAQTRAKHPVFTSIAVVTKGTHWSYDWTASPGTDEDGAEIDESDEIIDYDSYYSGRPSFRDTIRDKYPVGPAEHRRHVELWSATRDKLVTDLKGKTVKQAIAFLKKLNFEPAAKTKQAVYDAAREYLLDWFNDPKHFWVGPGSPNSAMGSRANAAKKQALAAIASGDVQAFRDAVAEYDANAYDPDPSGMSKGSRAAIDATIKAWKRDFKAAWGRV